MKGCRIGQGNTAEIFEWDESKILKLYRPGQGGTECRREFAGVQAVSRVFDGLPKAYEMVEIEGRFGAVYDRVRGHTLLEEMLRRPWHIGRYARLLAERHAALARPAADLGLPTVKQRVAAFVPHAGLPEKQQAAVLETLAALPDSDSLCHFDFHPGNLMLSDGQILVIDWPNACTGPPLADVARTWVVLRFSEMAEAGAAKRLVIRVCKSLVLHIYLREYKWLAGYDEDQLRKWQLVLMASRLAENVPEKTKAAVRAALEKTIQ